MEREDRHVDRDILRLDRYSGGGGEERLFLYLDIKDIYLIM